MNASDLALQVENIVQSIFPHSFVCASFCNSIFPSIHIQFAVGKDQTQWINGYIQNDIASVHLRIQKKGGQALPRDGQLDLIELEIEKHMSMYTIRPQIENRVYSAVKVPFRKTSGNSTKILLDLQRYFQRFKQSLIESRNANLITDQHMQLVGTNF